MPSNFIGDLPPLSSTPTPVVFQESLSSVSIYRDGAVRMTRDQVITDSLGNTVGVVAYPPLTRVMGVLPGYSVTVNGAPLTLEQWAALAVDFAVQWREEDNATPIVNP